MPPKNSREELLSKYLTGDSKQYSFNQKYLRIQQSLSSLYNFYHQYWNRSLTSMTNYFKFKNASCLDSTFFNTSYLSYWYLLDNILFYCSPVNFFVINNVDDFFLFLKLVPTDHPSFNQALMNDFKKLINLQNTQKELFAYLYRHAYARAKVLCPKISKIVSSKPEYLALKMCVEDSNLIYINQRQKYTFKNYLELQNIIFESRFLDLFESSIINYLQTCTALSQQYHSLYSNLNSFFEEERHDINYKIFAQTLFPKSAQYLYKSFFYNEEIKKLYFYNDNILYDLSNFEDFFSWVFPNQSKIRWEFPLLPYKPTLACNLLLTLIKEILLTYQIHLTDYTRILFHSLTEKENSLCGLLKPQEIFSVTNNGVLFISTPEKECLCKDIIKKWSLSNAFKVKNEKRFWGKLAKELPAHLNTINELSCQTSSPIIPPHQSEVSQDSSATNANLKKIKLIKSLFGLSDTPWQKQDSCCNKSLHKLSL